MLSLIPLSDSNPTTRRPYVTISLIVINIAIFFFIEPSAGADFEATRYFVEKAPLPCQIQDSCPDSVRFAPQLPDIEIPDRSALQFLGSVIFSTFLHAGFLHIAGNLLFLWIFGNNVEDHLGHFWFAIFYLGGGIVASLAHVLTHLGDVIPSVGASGAVAAVMGAYILLYPRARVKVLVPIFFIFSVVQMSALAVLGLWFLYQFLIGYQELSGATEVAWVAHVGGFVFGLAVLFAMGGRPQPPRPSWSPQWRY